MILKSKQSFKLTTVYRFFEILPGALAWLTIFLMFFLSWLWPVFIAIFVIIFDLYWLLKIIYLTILLHASFFKMRSNLEIDWLEKLKSENETKNNWGKLNHLIIFPMYNEPYEVVRESFTTLLKSNYPKEKFIVVLAIEDKVGREAREVAEKIREEFGDKFFKFVITSHPANLPGEIPGKGSNIAWAGEVVKKDIIDQLGVNYDDVVVSVFDVDTQVYPNYFGCLAYNFLTCENPQRSSFQPIPFFDNNIYQAPTFARMIAYSTTFWSMMQQSRPEQQVTFSSHSMPFKALVEIGFWQRDVVSEDSRIFWQCFLHYGGDWRVVPLFYPVSMDANAAPTFWATMKNIYKQQRRWGFGAENIAYMFNGFIKGESAKKISLSKKIYWSFLSIGGFHSWATNSLILFILGWLPIIFGGTYFSYTLLSYSLPQVTSFIMTLSSIGIITNAILGIILLPPKPVWFKNQHYFLYFFQWFLMPIVTIFLGAFPALEAQTRLMLGGKFRLGFWVTPKARNPETGKGLPAGRQGSGER